MLVRVALTLKKRFQIKYQFEKNQEKSKNNCKIMFT